MKHRIEVHTVPTRLRDRAGGSRLVSLAYFTGPIQYRFARDSEHAQQIIDAFECEVKRRDTEQFIEELLDRAEATP